MEKTSVKTLTCILIKKLISYCIIFEANKHIEWLSAWLLTAKVTVDKGRPKFHKFPRDENLKQQWKRRNIQSIQHIRMCHTYCFS